MPETGEGPGTDLRALSDAELAALAEAVQDERRRRAALCPTCGGHMKVWHLHVCTPEGGANLPLDSDMARRLTIAGV